MERISIREETEVVRERVQGLGPLVLRGPQPVGFGRRHEPRRHSFQQPLMQQLGVLELVQELERQEQEQERVLVEGRRRRAEEQALEAISEPVFEPVVWSARALPWAGKWALELRGLLARRQVLDGLRQAVALHSQALLALRIEGLPAVGVSRVCGPARERCQRLACVPIA